MAIWSGIQSAVRRVLKFSGITKGKFMQPLALLWFELQVAQQSLRESFAAGQRAANAANLDAPSSMATRRAASEKQDGRAHV